MVVTRHEKSEVEDTFLLRRFFVTSRVITTALIGAANSLTFDDGRKKSKIVIRAPPGNPFYGPAGRPSRRLAASRVQRGDSRPWRLSATPRNWSRRCWWPYRRTRPSTPCSRSEAAVDREWWPFANSSATASVCGTLFGTIDLLAAIRSPRRSTPKRAPLL
jgi:hypothetical protein